MLAVRACLQQAIRQYFQQHGYLEVETPLLSQDIVVDAHLDPLTVNKQTETNTSDRTTEHRRLFLQTSPEAGMKRLLAAGSGSIFQICKSFRGGECGTRHNPEFTMVEWYGIGDSYEQQMQMTEDLIRHAADCLHQSGMNLQLTDQEVVAVESSPLQSARYRRTTYQQAFTSALDLDPLKTSNGQLRQRCASFGLISETTDVIARDDLLNLLLAAKVEPGLGQGTAEFIRDYPISQAALAEVNSNDPRTACRFELYCNGIELCNGYQELTDAVELQRRAALENDRRQDRCEVELPGARRLQQAMQQGLPRCSGVALGFDRLVMCLLGKAEISDVIPFPSDRA
ncbi:MAG: elongation factor P--(R)-beta-lysine ligase [Fuerstiella sp.]